MRLEKSLVLLLATGALVVAGNAAAEAPEPDVTGSGREQEAPPAATPSAEELEARTLFTLGVQMAEAERWAEAEKSFARSEALVPRASTAFNRALALYRLGRIREMLLALERFLERSDPVTDARDRSHAESLRQSGQRALATLVLRVSPADATVRVDGEPLGETAGDAERKMAVDPGDHVVTADGPGLEPARVEVSVSAGEQAPVALTLSRRPEAAPPAPSMLRSTSPPDEGSWTVPLGPLVLTLAGAASLVGAGVTGIIALDLDSRIEAGCTSQDRCYDDLADDQDRMESLAAGSTWLTVAGIALAGTGITWWLLSPRGEKRAQVGAYVSGTTAGMKGAF